MARGLTRRSFATESTSTAGLGGVVPGYSWWRMWIVPWTEPSLDNHLLAPELQMSKCPEPERRERTARLDLEHSTAGATYQPTRARNQQ